MKVMASSTLLMAMKKAVQFSAFFFKNIFCYPSKILEDLSNFCMKNTYTLPLLLLSKFL